MSTDPDSSPTNAGRPVILTPVPPGLWLVIGGGVVAALGPLFGFLIGSMMGSDTQVADLEPIYLFLFLGLLLGGVGIAMIILGARKLYRSRGITMVDVS
jgi:hypothetical protein